MKRFILLTIAWIIIGMLVCLVVSYGQKTLHHHIILRFESGFSPSVVHLKKNDALTFINLTRVPTWPAAGPHPTHTSYPAFDPQEGIAPWHHWTFKFAQEGTFTFHDHFAPEKSGIVVSGNTDASQASTQSECTAMDDMEQQASCIEIYFKNLTDKASFTEALAIFNDISVRYPDRCHTFGHDLGKNAYTAYVEGQNINMGEETSACGFGFWHGFTTAMQAHKGIEASSEFCATLGGATPAMISNNRMNCYHGIGIGFIPDPPPQNLWGKFKEIVEPGLAFCDTVEGDPSFKEQCLRGVFHAMTVDMAKNLYGFSFGEDALHNCQEQKAEHQRTCFSTLAAQVPDLSGFDFHKTALIFKESVPSQYFDEVLMNAAVIFVDPNDSVEDISNFIGKCATESSDYRPLCVTASVHKLFTHGLPGIEYKKAVALCSSKGVLDIEKDACFKVVLDHSVLSYSSEKIKGDVCALIPSLYRSSLPECAGS